MKELSIQERAEAYDKVREKIALRFGSNVAEEIFSEYEESEDERIKDAINYAICQSTHKDGTLINGVTRESALAWLEKQGEHAKFRNKIQIGDKVARNRDGMLVNLSQLKRVAKPADKFEPKFHEGEWIVKNDDSLINIDYSCCKITNVENGNYTIKSIYGYKGYNTFETFEKDYHLWTIKDAKDGDVLYNRDDFAGNSVFIYKGISDKTHACLYYTRLFKDKDFRIYNDVMWKNGCGVNGGEFYPANKEQCDLLFQKMKEAN